MPTRSPTDPSPTPLWRGRRLSATRTVAGAIAVATASLLAAACGPPPLNEQTAPPAAGAAGGPQASHIAAGSRLGIGPCPVYPRNNIFHADISTLPTAPGSAATIATAGAQLGVHPGFHAAVWEGSRGGIPVNVVDSRTTPPVPVTLGAYAYLSDPGPHPIPGGARLEGHPGLAWDRHLLVVDTATCRSTEMFYVTPPGPLHSFWHADTAVTLDLRSNRIRPTTATASGTSLLAGMVRYDEVAAGRVDHMVGITLPSISSAPPTWPASATDGVDRRPSAPRMGTVFRLKSTVSLSGLGPQATTIARALQRHGAVVVDTGPARVTLGGENDPRWNDSDILGLRRFALSDFEVVDVSALKVAEGSYEIR